MNRSYLSKIKYLVSVLLVTGLLVTCDSISDFGDMNEDPTQANTVEPGMLFTTVQLSATGTRYEMWRAQLLYGSNVIQHTVNAFYIGGNNYTETIDWLTAFWNTAYSGTGIPQRAQVKNIEGLIDLLETRQEEGEEVDNMLASARIMRVFIYHRITDLYGDAPYFEAGKGAIDLEYTPVYDSQQDIYDDMFNELDEAVNQFDSSQRTFGSNDLMYGGDITQWQKFGNSLRLRLALRLVKIDDESKAETEALAAINAPGGVMTSNDDIAMVQHQSGPSSGPAGLNTNAISEAMNDGGDHEFVAQAMVNWMDNRDDPRLGVYAQTDKPFLGFPSGYTSSSVTDHPDYPGSVDDYSRVNPMLIGLDDPTFFQTYAEVEFMLAELAVRNWTSDAASAHYEAGVRAAMEYLSLYDEDGGADIADGEIDTYLANNPFETGTTEDQLEQINEQYWAAIFLNGIEAWSNWRRSGYPDLEPAMVDSNEPPAGNQTNGEIPRRLIYPEGTEGILNAENYNEVIDRQGENNMVTRVWWDVEN